MDTGISVKLLEAKSSRDNSGRLLKSKELKLLLSKYKDDKLLKSDRDRELKLLPSKSKYDKLGRLLKSKELKLL